MKNSGSGVDPSIRKAFLKRKDYIIAYSTHLREGVGTHDIHHINLMLSLIGVRDAVTTIPSLPYVVPMDNKTRLIHSISLNVIVRYCKHLVF